MDAWAYRSHMRAIAGIDNGSFTAEIVPIEVTRRDGTTFTFAVDEHPRRGTSMEKLASLKPLHPEIEGFSITAGNAAGVNDGAAAIVVTSRSFAEERGLGPQAIIRAWASAGVPPADTGLAPSIAIPKALDRAGLKIDDIALWEINEAFASVPVAVTRELGIDDAIVNVLGSGCSLGHPVAIQSKVASRACVSCWNTLISLASPSVTRNSSTTSTVAERPVDLAVQVCVVTCTTRPSPPKMRGSVMVRDQYCPKTAPIDAIPS